MNTTLLLRAALPLAVLSLLAACTTGGVGGPAPTPDGGGLEPYTVKGQVTDTQGRPLAGVEVFADNTAYYDMNVFGVTDAGGFYRIELGDVTPSSWHVGAYLERDYNGYTYSFSLHPDAAAVFAGVDGAIRNLEWRLSGETPEGGYYGGLVYFYGDYANGDLDTQYAELTFTPNGPLVDGSAGQTFTVTSPSGTEITDVPIGRYTVTARYVPPGEAPSPLLIRVRDAGTYASAATADFIPDDLYGVLMELEVSRP